MYKNSIFILILLTAVYSFAQYDSLWTRQYGYADIDKFWSALESADSNYTFAGFLDNPSTGNYEGWLIKTDRDGDTLWTKAYGGTIWTILLDHIETSDGGFVMAGHGVSTTDGYGGADFEAIKTDSQGEVIWRKWYGGTDREECRSVCETPDSGYIFAGRTTSFGAGGFDFYVVKTDALGDTLWTRAYGLVDSEECYSVAVTSDNCILLAGYTQSLGAGYEDFWLIKTDINGDTLWTKTYGGASTDICNHVTETSDSCYLLAGVSENDAILIKTDKDGNTIWTRTFGDSLYDEAYDVFEAANGDYILAGEINPLMMLIVSKDGDVMFEAESSSNLGICYDAFETHDNAFVLGGARNDNGYIVKVGDVTLSDFSIINRGTEYVSTDSIEFKWHPSGTPFVSIGYNISLNGNLDATFCADTVSTILVPIEGVCVWTVRADNGYNNLYALNSDTFIIDRTGPVLLSIEEINDTAFSGPFDIEFLAADSSAGVDSAALYYMLPEDTIWSRTSAVHIGGLKFRATIPEATSVGILYYYPELYDKAVPANVSSHEVRWFRITGLSGIASIRAEKYGFEICGVGNGEISFTLPSSCPVNVRLFDVSGREVMEKSVEMKAGKNSMNFDVAQGVYFINLETPFGSARSKIVKVK